MERIQEAIEKARRERQGNIGGASSPDSPPNDDGATSDAMQLSESQAQDDVATEAQSSDEPSSRKSGSSIRVNYSQTRTIELNEQELKDRRIVAGFAHDARSEPYRQLRGQLLNTFRENDWQTLAIPSSNSCGGISLTAYEPCD